MGAVRMRVQTAGKKITIIHMTPVHQLLTCEVHFLYKPLLSKSESGEKYAQIKHCLQAKTD